MKCSLYQIVLIKEMYILEDVDVSLDVMDSGLCEDLIYWYDKMEHICMLHMTCCIVVLFTDQVIYKLKSEY